jgi:CO/xanthine dehydrogenase FAD-binding subunit
VRVRKAAALLLGTSPTEPDFDATLQSVAAAAHKQCHPLDNIPGDADYRREMVPVYVARTLRAALSASGPVHHI